MQDGGVGHVQTALNQVKASSLSSTLPNLRPRDMLMDLWDRQVRHQAQVR